MSKLTCLFMCVVAASLCGVDAFTDDVRSSIRSAVSPIVNECATENGYTTEDINKARDTNTIENLKPCFFACAFKKAGIINEEGQYNSRNALDSVLEKHVADLSEYQNKAEKCTSVNDKAVSDGAAGCERATQVIECLFVGQGVELVI